jgi:arginase
LTLGQPYIGADHSPKLLREAGLLENLESIGWLVHDNGDLDISAENTVGINDELYSAHNSQIVGKGCEILAQAVVDAIKKGRFPLILGGDHSIGAGSLAGLLKGRPNTGVIWVDAHADLNTPEMSESGNMHGMPVGLLMKGMVKQNSMIPGFEWLDSEEMRDVRLDPDSIVYIGLRDVDAKEREILREKKIRCFTMYDIDKDGIGGVMEKALDHLLQKDPNRPLHLSYDIDAVDPHIAQATGTPVRGGLTYREAHFVAEAAARSGNLASAEIVELNPSLSNDSGAAETMELGLGLLTSLMGKSII